MTTAYYRRSRRIPEMPQESLPATLFRGGTTKGVYFQRADMPDDRESWDAMLLSTFGSPDPKQIDGVGGSHSTASKAMIVAASETPGVDVEYLFAQVGIETPVVDWGGNCGNLTYAVGPFALERGLVDATGPEPVELVLENANTGTVVEQSVPVDAEGSPEYQGDFEVHGVRGTGARVPSRFLDPGGSESDAVFPTGDRQETLQVPGLGTLTVSLIDVSNPCVFARASDLGMTATELPEKIDDDPELLDRLERVRSAACARFGFVDDAAAATARSPGIPKMVVVDEQRSYESVAGETVDTDEFDLLARIMSMGKAHHAFSVTGAMCTAVAAALPGTLPSEYLADGEPEAVVIGHPKGTMRVGTGLDGDEVAYAEVDRTARQLMHGDLYYPADR
jgi:2-methylaconitate cis-trans-isomerase PrpF